jgi:hypothetical protein
VDQRLETPSNAADALGSLPPQSEIRVTMKADQGRPPIGAEVNLNRSDGSSIKVVLATVDVLENGDQVLTFVVPAV